MISQNNVVTSVNNKLRRQWTMDCHYIDQRTVTSPSRLSRPWTLDRHHREQSTVITVNNGQLWFDLSDLSRWCRTFRFVMDGQYSKFTGTDLKNVAYGHNRFSRAYEPQKLTSRCRLYRDRTCLINQVASVKYLWRFDCTLKRWPITGAHRDAELGVMNLEHPILLTHETRMFISGSR